MRCKGMAFYPAYQMFFVILLPDNKYQHEKVSPLLWSFFIMCGRDMVSSQLLSRLDTPQSSPMGGVVLSSFGHHHPYCCAETRGKILTLTLFLYPESESISFS